MHSRKFWVYFVQKKSDRLFYVAMLPFRYRKNPVTMKRMSLLSERSFRSEALAVVEARWLFGDNLEWKRTEGAEGQLRAPIHLATQI
jgi:hypothetical protein